MKSILDRLRCWLISKLGGYTNQIEIRAEERMTPFTSAIRPSGSVDVMRRLMDRVENEMLEHGFLKFERVDNGPAADVVFSLTTYVVPTEGVEKGCVEND